MSALGYTLPELEKFLHVQMRNIGQAALLQAGKFFHGRSLSHTVSYCRAWKKWFMPTTKECYYNAAYFALEHQVLGVKYAEGYWLDPEASTFLYHAWNVLADGRVIDFTQEAADHHLEREPNLECLYFGITIPTDYLRKQIIHTGAARNYAGQYLAERSGRDTRIERNRKQETKNKR